MCDDMKQLEEQLEKITAAGDAVDESLDAESARLRQGWVALARLIEAVEGDLPGPSDLRIKEFEPPPRHRRPSWLPSAALMALAASLFVAAATAGLSMWQNRETTAKQQTAIALALTDSSAAESSPTTVESPPTMLADNDNPNDDNAAADQDIADDTLDWDSSLDTEIAAASDAMLWIQAEQYASDDAASSLYYRIELLRQELNETTL